ncbi:two component transcriptional regulator, LuxR family [Cyclonatronum proteinivorum]|uniref:Two component transcriptional regulator, LuxR family n=1 Tax=Cyclonatronum proteinivorum TaxID=1457365 RepID=A0A345UPY8_9BACT|nr:response regulator transcription factor [Cyclonatronum proteinivorum]AXJ02540.1 two component transcriptional regulator, LuxR family [Cyclonatronum proteinivorum]
MSVITILVADDHSVVRLGLTSILNSVPTFKVVAEASSGIEAVDLYKEFKPDVCLLDITMPELDGIDACREILKEDADARIIMMTIHLDEKYLNEVLEAGALGYMLKSSGKDEIINNIHRVLNNERVFSKAVSDMITTSFLSRNRKTEAPKAASKLTKREKEILGYIVDGKTNQEIAEVLSISPRTVETHRSNLMHKMGVKNTAALVKKALAEDMI